MKLNIINALTILLLASCSGGGKLEYGKAKETAENCMKAIDKGDFQGVKDNYYSDNYGTTSTEDLNKKFTKLKDVCGDLVSYTLKDSSSTSEVGEEAQVVLTYEVKHSNTTTTEQFVIVEQNGKYKIANHAVNN